MRVVQTAGFYFPDSIGGTEVYVRSLAKELRTQRIDCVIAAPHSSDDATTSKYNYDQTEVFRYPFPGRPSRAETLGRVPHRHFHVFKSWLREQGADVYHQHSWTTGCGLWHLKAAKEIGLKTFLTLHLPSSICMRGTMLYQGQAPCDGKIISQRCAKCWLDSKGVSPLLARSLAWMPEGILPITQVPHLGPALAARALAAERRATLHEMASVADRIVAVCGWLYESLLANGVPSTKLLLNRQGVANAGAADRSAKRDRTANTVSLGFIGRWDPLKGVHVLIDAFKRLPKSARLELHLLATAAGPENEKYREVVKASARSEPRIHFREEPGYSVAEFFAGVDVLMVPSQWFETGPLVVLEAFSHGKPVIGSDLGGIKELVTDGQNGLLIPHADVDAWSAAMQRLSDNRFLIDHLQAGIGPVRTMADVAREMGALYSGMVGERNNAA